MTPSETAKTNKASSAANAEKAPPRKRRPKAAARSGESNGRASERSPRESAEGPRSGEAKASPRRSSATAGNGAPAPVREKKRPRPAGSNGASLARTEAGSGSSEASRPARRVVRKKRRKPAKAAPSFWRRAGLAFQSLRLMVVVLGLILALVVAAALGFFKNPRKPAHASPIYDDAVAYSNRFELEKDQYEPGPDVLVLLPGAQVEENDANPAENYIRQRIVYTVARPARFVAEQLSSRWRGAGLSIERAKPDDKGGFSLSAKKPGTGEMAIIASVKPLEEEPGHSRVSATLFRHPTTREESWFKYPDDLPEGPRGASLDVKSGAMGPSRLGRVYSWAMPVDANGARDYFRLAMLRKGWQLQPLSAQQDASAQASAKPIYSYMCRKGADSYTMNISALGDAGSGRSAVVFIAF